VTAFVYKGPMAERIKAEMGKELAAHVKERHLFRAIKTRNLFYLTRYRTLARWQYLYNMSEVPPMVRTREPVKKLSPKTLQISVTCTAKHECVFQTSRIHIGELFFNVRLGMRLCLNLFK
jgi:hypothetical protein